MLYYQKFTAKCLKINLLETELSSILLAQTIKLLIPKITILKILKKFVLGAL